MLLELQSFLREFSMVDITDVDFLENKESRKVNNINKISSSGSDPHNHRFLTNTLVTLIKNIFRRTIKGWHTRAIYWLLPHNNSL
jgi:hypothetical protein